MSSTGLKAPGEVRWRVGHVSDPIGFLPRERCSWNHRFDDPDRRFRTLYCAIEPETALREVLADLRRDTREVANYLATLGANAAVDLPAQEITADWRRQNVLVECRIQAKGEILDLTDPAIRHEMEIRHAALLATHGMAHLDITEITLPRRSVTRKIAADAYHELGCAAIRINLTVDLCRKSFGTSYADPRPLSGTSAVTNLLVTLPEPGQRILLQTYARASFGGGAPRRDHGSRSLLALPQRAS